jgi:hypothetical protein
MGFPHHNISEVLVSDFYETECPRCHAIESIDLAAVTCSDNYHCNGCSLSYVWEEDWVYDGEGDSYVIYPVYAKWKPIDICAAAIEDTRSQIWGLQSKLGRLEEQYKLLKLSEDCDKALGFGEYSRGVRDLGGNLSTD